MAGSWDSTNLPARRAVAGDAQRQNQAAWQSLKGQHQTFTRAAVRPETLSRQVRNLNADQLEDNASNRSKHSTPNRC